MLTVKCQTTISLLLKEDDFNVRVTVAKNAIPKSRFTLKSSVEAIWKEYIRDCIGKILNTDTEYITEMLIIKDDGTKKFSATLTGKQLAKNLLLSSILDCDGFRITITMKDKKELSWIIVKP